MSFKVRDARSLGALAGVQRFSDNANVVGIVRRIPERTYLPHTKATIPSSGGSIAGSAFEVRIRRGRKKGPRRQFRTFEARRRVSI